MTAFEKGMSWYKIKTGEQPLLLTYLGFIPYLSMATFLKVYNHVNQLNILFKKYVSWYMYHQYQKLVVYTWF